jgi:hypothetical protein
LLEYVLSLSTDSPLLAQHNTSKNTSFPLRSPFLTAPAVVPPLLTPFLTPTRTQTPTSTPTLPTPTLPIPSLHVAPKRRHTANRQATTPLLFIRQLSVRDGTKLSLSTSKAVSAWSSRTAAVEGVIRLGPGSAEGEEEEGWTILFEGGTRCQGSFSTAEEGMTMAWETEVEEPTLEVEVGRTDTLAVGDGRTEELRVSRSRRVDASLSSPRRCRKEAGIRRDGRCRTLLLRVPRLTLAISHHIITTLPRRGTTCIITSARSRRRSRSTTLPLRARILPCPSSLRSLLPIRSLQLPPRFRARPTMLITLYSITTLPTVTQAPPSTTTMPFRQPTSTV